MTTIKKTKVLHVVGSMNRGGTETMLMNLYRNMDRDRISFDFVSYGSNEAHYDKEIKQLGGRIIKLTKTTSIKQIYQIIKQYGPYDVVHAHTLFHCGIVSLAAFLAGVNIRIAHAHTNDDQRGRFIKKLYIKIMRQLINRFSTNLVACSNEAGRYLFGKENLSKTKYSYFPNAIDYSIFLHVPIHDVKQFKLEQEIGTGITIGHIGTFKQSKNHLFLLKILNQLIKKDSTIQLLLVGDGELREQIETEAEKLGLVEHIKFVGIKENISTMLHSMDVFVFPSLYEGLGLVLLESQASGTPSVVSEAIQPEADIGAGLITKLSLSDGIDQWATKIIELANKKENNINHIKNRFEQSNYSITKGLDHLQDLYQCRQGGVYEQNTDRLL